VATIDEAQVLVAIREFEADGVPLTVYSLAAYLHWDEQRVRSALATHLLDGTVYFFDSFLHASPSPPRG
jgi:hypothetical protein